jgi:hypothetical protein
VARLLGEGLGGRVLAFDRSAAAYGEITRGRRAAGRPIASADGQIAAIGRARGAVLLAARDLGGFQDCGVPIINPWRA